IFHNLREINARGLSIFLVEQNVRQALKLAHHAYVLENGLITLSGTGKDLMTDARVLEAYLGG
ncbi:MAG: ABC transporter ATP-binding protein, partial [Burkholderiaceae bacterium]|nr:ABC transporter ATP-binding protein [Burkholderiaceae bacterium]